MNALDRRIGMKWYWLILQGTRLQRKRSKHTRPPPPADTPTRFRMATSEPRYTGVYSIHQFCISISSSPPPPCSPDWISRLGFKY
ncbi:uncharacterized protein FOMMEDRAFT_137707 [Fomitiporia mediterranea MF3/22]|uniref:uncharacterized protein n=1 Tax=Fomitiporia mediterranea (strain MF3/22) TaxID=694068 RepID=UPI0004408BB2|nr:uncharacterized protein FOMMEDRAFT_137707 [Fomitiporia mediterranea MF3/22]EJD07371.1 hypothetical protein FOMMEDRAFT_137707 [Fomitiporia mediterranea MF3/22]